MNIPARIEKVRKAMAAEGLDAYIVTGSDPHGSEIPPEAWRTRKWLSGFTGSAGIVVVTEESGGLWTDFRYWIMAADEIAGSGLRLFRDGAAEVPEPEQWLGEVLKSGSKVAVDGRTVDFATADKWRRYLGDRGIVLDGRHDLVGPLWTDRPEPSQAPLIELDEDDTGESRSARLERLAEKLTAARADIWIGTALDSNAWLLNLRGGDVPYNPVITGYIIYVRGVTTWYTNLERISDDLCASLADDGIELANYDDFGSALGRLPADGTLMFDGSLLSLYVSENLPPDLGRRFAADPVFAMKAVKNATQIAHLRRAMEKDGVAMVRFFIDLEEKLKAGERIGEVEAAKMLRIRRAEIPGFLGESFPTIPAAGEHGAICHYEAREAEQAYLESPDDLFLVDSGGQWDEGTTDITRTLSLGRPTRQQREDYTKVLKAHIVLSRLRFPAGTRGYQIDAITRAGLWKDGLDYGHGTGHGVGFRLNVHEGPQRLNTMPIDVAIEPGMIVSNEPGLYREGRYGIRIENLVVCREDGESEFGAFLAFETLSLAPYHPALIDSDLLDDNERDWLNDYHENLRERLAPLLEAEEIRWLEETTKAI